MSVESLYPPRMNACAREAGFRAIERAELSDAFGRVVVVDRPCDSPRGLPDLQVTRELQSDLRRGLAGDPIAQAFPGGGAHAVDRLADPRDRGCGPVHPGIIIESD